MTSERIKEIQQTTAYPESVSLMLALKQVWNECAQEKSYSEEDLKKAQLAILCNIKDALLDENYIIDYLTK